MKKCRAAFWINGQSFSLVWMSSQKCKCLIDSNVGCAVCKELWTEKILRLSTSKLCWNCLLSCLFDWNAHQLKVALNQKMLKDFQISKKIFHFSILNYPKLLHPVHGNDKILIAFDILQVRKILQLWNVAIKWNYYGLLLIFKMLWTYRIINNVSINLFV